ncbi:MAG TPA: hypothetical protein VLB67_16175 [Acidimicrobiia bacterium]|nr:hypothetical protein [Acidimicrobiia bacterium]
MDHADLLDELHSIRRRTNADLASGAWRWLTLWAGVCFGFLSTLVIPPLHPASRRYWLYALPLGLAGTVIVDAFNKRADRRVRRNDWPYVATTLAMVVATTGASLVLPGRGMLVWLWIVLAAGFGTLLTLDGERTLGRAFGGLTLVFAVVAPFTVDATTTSIAFGTVVVAALVAAALIGHRGWSR